MKELNARIETSKDGIYYAYLNEEIEFHLTGEGASVSEAKEDFLNVYNAQREKYKDEFGVDVDIHFTFSLDLSAFLQHYKDVITIADISVITGVSEECIARFISEEDAPSDINEQIKTSLCRFAEELKNTVI